MKKDRFIAFFDAILAIIMTIIVLEFIIPNGTDWSDLGTLWFQIIAYAVSFFWLGGMWINIHTLWHDVETIDRSVLFTNLALLFFSSMIPFFAVYFGRNITSKVPAILYGADVIIVTLLNELSAEFLAKHNASVKAMLGGFRLSIAIDTGIKAAGLIVGILCFPPAVLIGVLAAMVFITWHRVYLSKKQGLKKNDPAE